MINNHQSNLHFLGTCKSNKNVLILKTHENTIKNFNDKNMINRRENQLILVMRNPLMSNFRMIQIFRSYYIQFTANLNAEIDFVPSHKKKNNKYIL